MSRTQSTALLRSKLLSRIHRRFGTVKAQVSVGGISFDFYRVADPDKVLDETAAEEDRREKLDGVRYAEPLHLPYWAEVWDSAGGIAGYLEQQPRLEGQSALDLGCGQGLSGCAAAALGANVLFADLESPALLFARLNSLPFAERTRFRKLNWQRDHLPEQFDLIVGADILYERAQWEWLERFWRQHLKPTGRVVLGEPGRPSGDGFLDWIGSRGWSVQRATQPVPTRPQPIRIIQVQRLS